MEYKVYKSFEEMYEDLRHPRYISHPVAEEKKEEKPKKSAPKKSSKKKEEK